VALVVGQVTVNHAGRLVQQVLVLQDFVVNQGSVHDAGRQLLPNLVVGAQVVAHQQLVEHDAQSQVDCGGLALELPDDGVLVLLRAPQVGEHVAIRVGHCQCVPLASTSAITGTPNSIPHLFNQLVSSIIPFITGITSSTSPSGTRKSSSSWTSAMA